MKLKRFITEEEKDRLLELSRKEKLVADSKNKYHAETMRDDPDVIWISALLKDVIEEFASFSNFTKTDHRVIRIQHHWDERFTGVGYVSIHELHEGFEPGSTQA